ncbi:hypothetical protein ACHAQA_004556 [Verticillium albo-atrum]
MSSSNFDVLKNAAEPGFIVAAFTIGSLINRRRTYRDDEEKRLISPNQSPPLEPSSPVLDHCESRVQRRPTQHLNIFSRFLRAFPFLVEIWYWNLTYWVYQLLRAFSARMIAGNMDIFLRAQNHALSILSFEQTLGIAIEQPLQAYILKHHPDIMAAFARIYYSHICLGIVFIIYTYTYFAPSTFQQIRRTIALNNYIAFVILTTWRCMPPRLLPEQYGFIDVLHGGSHGGSAWTSNRFQLTIAAMPSLHFGTSLFLAVTIVRFSPHKPLRMLAPFWPVAMLLTIVSTANHFLLDAAVGACVPLLGWRYNRVMLRLKPIQDCVLNFLNIEYPADPYGREVDHPQRGTKAPTRQSGRFID